MKYATHDPAHEGLTREKENELVGFPDLSPGADGDRAGLTDVLNKQ